MQVRRSAAGLDNLQTPTASLERAHWLPPALLLAVLVPCYLPALTATYGYADDFPQLLESLQRIKWVQDAWNQAARPIGGWLTEWSFHAAGSIAGLAYLRAVSLLLLLLLALAIYRHLLALLYEPALAALAAAFVCTQTPVQVNVGWASMWLYMIPPALSYAAYHAVLRAGGGAVVSRAKWLLLALLLLYISFNIYPPSTMFLWFWFGTDALLADISLARLLRRFALLLIACGAAGITYYGIYKALGYHHPRGQFTPDIVRKLGWFLRGVLPVAARLQWYDYAPAWLPVMIGVLVIAGIVLRRQNSILHRAVRLVLGAATVFLSYLPLLLLKEFYAPFRSQLVLTIYLGTLAFLSIFWIMVRLKTPVASRYLVLCALVMAGVVRGNANLVRHVVLPQSFDYMFLRGQLTSALAARKNAVVLEGTLPPNCWDELCRVTSEMPHDYRMLKDMAQLVAQESPHAPGYYLQVVPHNTPVTPADSTAIIDMQAVMEMLN